VEHVAARVHAVDAAREPVADGRVAVAGDQVLPLACGTRRRCEEEEEE